MSQSLLHVALVVRDYDEAIEFFCTKLRFDVVEDTVLPEQNKRWVLVAPPGSRGTNVLLAKAATDQHRGSVGNQTGGRVAVFEDLYGNRWDLLERKTAQRADR